MQPGLSILLNSTSATFSPWASRSVSYFTSDPLLSSATDSFTWMSSPILSFEGVIGYCLIFYSAMLIEGETKLDSARMISYSICSWC
jgi:hypothetical protein